MLLSKRCPRVINGDVGANTYLDWATQRIYWLPSCQYRLGVMKYQVLWPWSLWLRRQFDRPSHCVGAPVPALCQSPGTKNWIFHVYRSTLDANVAIPQHHKYTRSNHHKQNVNSNNNTNNNNVGKYVRIRLNCCCGRNQSQLQRWQLNRNSNESDTVLRNKWVHNVTRSVSLDCLVMRPPTPPHHLRLIQFHPPGCVCLRVCVWELEYESRIRASQDHL